MIEFFSSWTKTLGLAIIIVSILEMLLPNNKTKKYIRMVMGIYILFTIISPFISNKDKFNINNIDIENYGTTQTSSNIDQTSMNKRIEELYAQELEKDIVNKLKEKGFDIQNCKVNIKISDEEENTKITKIKIKAKKLIDNEQTQKNKNLENQIVVEIQKIKPINTAIRNRKFK